LEFIELKANTRAGIGKGRARSLRREGSIPAILYGPKTEPVLLSVNTREIEQVLKKGNIGQTLLNIMIQNNGETAVTRSAMLKALQRHPVSRNFLHADFYEFSMDRKLRVKIPVVTKGIPLGIDKGGMLQIIRREVEVLCLPNEIPEKIEIDVSGLDVGESVHVNDLPREGNIEIPAEVNFTVVTVVGAKAEKVEVAEGEAVEGEAEAEPAEK
jgi:large subunit ribosomal protein L25